VVKAVEEKQRNKVDSGTISSNQEELHVLGDNYRTLVKRQDNCEAGVERMVGVFKGLEPMLGRIFDMVGDPGADNAAAVTQGSTQCLSCGLPRGLTWSPHVRSPSPELRGSLVRTTSPSSQKMITAPGAHPETRSLSRKAPLANGVRPRAARPISAFKSVAGTETTVVSTMTNSSAASRPGSAKSRPQSARLMLHDSTEASSGHGASILTDATAAGAAQNAVRFSSKGEWQSYDPAPQNMAAFPPSSVSNAAARGRRPNSALARLFTN